MHRDDQETKKKQSDIPKIPFNVRRYQEALELGYYRILQSKTHIVLERLHANNNTPGSGFGMAVFRKLVQLSITLDCPGKISTVVSTTYGSPHLFFLYMGMAPTTYPIYYLDSQYGEDGHDVREKLYGLSEYSEWNTEILEIECDADVLNGLKRILRREMGVSTKNKIISLEDIVAHRELLLKLKEQARDYVSDRFIPHLLKILASNPTDKYPDTSELGSVNMYLTEEGLARWKFVIDNNLEFIPFKNFAHLNLSTAQQTLLKEILEKRVQSAPRP